MLFALPGWAQQQSYGETEDYTALTQLPPWDMLITPRFFRVSGDILLRQSPKIV